MPRKYRITYAGYYHVINRGVERRNIFLEPIDYEYFLDLLVSIKDKYNITIHSFCLMTNHYHILLQTYSENISDAIKYLNSIYSIYFNKKYKRVGHLWQGRFKSYYLYDDEHFWIVAKYIERNPIKANLITNIDLYTYQSFFQWKYKHNYFQLLEDSMIFNMTLQEYEEYINAEINTDTLEIIYTTPNVIKIDDNYKVLTKRLETFFEQDRDINRNINIKKAYTYGYTKIEIADFVGLSSNAITKIVL